MSDLKHIEMCWDSYRDLIIPAGASGDQIMEARQAFYSGASILFKTLLLALDPGDKETDADMLMMASLQAEVDDFGLELDLRLLPIGGNA